MPTPHADGPDIAHYQTLTGKPVDPAWRLFSHKCSEGAFSGDAMFPARWAWMRAQGFKYRSAYHWLRSDSTVKDQVANLCRRLDALGGLQRGEFVQIDWETTPNIAVPTSLMAAESCDRVEQHYGRACTVTYTGTWLPDSPLDADTRREFLEWRDENPDAPLWLAFYNTSAGWKACADAGAAIWQYTSGYKHPSIVTPHRQPDGTVIFGGFDMNHVFAWSTLDRITDQVAAPPPPPTPTPLPIDPVIGASGEMMIYCYIDANGTVWVGNGLARRAIPDMTLFAQYVALSTSGGGPRLVSGSGVPVRGIDDVAHVGAATIDALGKPI